MSDDRRREVEALERQRLEADRRYNDALTAVDAAIVRAPGQTSSIPATTLRTPALPDGWRGRLLRIIEQWLAPLIAQQQAVNERLAASVAASDARAQETAVALERFETALIVFLQQITPLVDTKARLVESVNDLRLVEHDKAIGSIKELRAQVETLQRIVQSIKRSTSIPERASLAASAGAAPAAAQAPRDSGRPADVTYVGFEDRFRGTAEEIRERQAAYLPVFASAADVLDIGCGRGEFLDLLKGKGVSARGIDVNREMVAVARERGLDATESDALTFIEGLADESLGGVMCSQVIEHLEPSYLIRVLEVLSHKLRPGAPAVIETINPACWLAFFSSYIRDFTHVRPIHPETLEYLLHASGFGRVSTRYSAPVPDQMKMAAIHLPADMSRADDAASRALMEATRILNSNAAVLNSLMFSFMDYAAIAFRS